MATKTEIPIRLSIAWLREQYAAGTITPEDVVRELVRRANEDAEMNVWITPPEPERIKPYLERLRSIDPKEAPLWGIPFAAKDNIDVSGLPTTAACAEYAYVPETHATVVERLVAAGAIPMGKTNLDQFATGLVGTRSPYGETHNALRRELISGGSSSGSAVAVARGHAAFALGTDTAGSGRVPAALNGLYGWKPSVGAWPTRGVVPACASLDCVTAFAHTLEDALAVDEAVRGEDALDPWSRPIPRLPSSLPSKLLVPKGPLEFYGPYAEAYEAAWNAAVERAEATGLPVERIDVELFAQAAEILYGGPWVAERWAGLGDFIEAHPGTAWPVTERVLRSGASGTYDAASVFAAAHRLQRFKSEAKRLLGDGALVMPTCGGTWTREQVRDDPIATNSAMGKYTNHCNLLDLCAVSVPCGEAAPELPFGVTLFASSGKEGLLEAAARRFAVRTPTTEVAVCGLHMRGLPLEPQMRRYGGRFVREDATAAKYRMYKLPTEPAKPGLVKTESGGASIRLEIWELPLETFGVFVAGIPAPLGIGKVELQGGTEVPGFVCEAVGTVGAEDITAFGGWRGLEDSIVRK
ncbi:allophanate hydrolase [Paenibacillus antri]|uniref:Allophanate hydrolase n=1 Tax=Paenibacillus antri TaxID=2582848 RepID=A0A5R9FYZ8_9BACL|nr:allophanate hydrolase [Paenibacillus antri]TLS49282.1 allophanate hydrolase [Paenibacillus antri]